MKAPPPPAAAAAFLLLLLFLFSGAPHLFSDASKVGESCTNDGSCDAGLHCDACGSTCTRTTPIDPKSKGKGLPFNRYSWLTTHNSFAIQGQRSGIIAPTNQEDTVTQQLNNGVRGLMLDMYDFQNDIWLCHSFGGKCYDFTAFQPAINVLKEIQAFLQANPTEIITIFIEDYVTATQGLTNVFDAAGLRKYWFPVSKMPKNGTDWPLISDMISLNERMIVFTSKSAKEASEGIAYEWNYLVENQYGNDGMNPGSCPSRAESATMSTTTRSLVLMNYFQTNPDLKGSCQNNSSPLIEMLNTCHKLSGNRWANFIAVDFYKRSDGGGAPLATDTANGHLVCGCDNIAYCRVNATFGTCDIPPAAAPAPKSRTPIDQRQRDLTSAGSRLSSWCLIQIILVYTLLLLI